MPPQCPRCSPAPPRGGYRRGDAPRALQSPRPAVQGHSDTGGPELEHVPVGAGTFRSGPAGGDSPSEGPRSSREGGGGSGQPLPARSRRRSGGEATRVTPSHPPYSSSGDKRAAGTSHAWVRGLVAPRVQRPVLPARLRWDRRLPGRVRKTHFRVFYLLLFSAAALAKSPELRGRRAVPCPVPAPAPVEVGHGVPRNPQGPRVPPELRHSPRGTAPGAAAFPAGFPGASLTRALRSGTPGRGGWASAAAQLSSPPRSPSAPRPPARRATPRPARAARCRPSAR